MPFPKLTKENVSKVPRVSGQYTIRNSRGTPIYAGVSKKGEYGNLRHRLQSYYQDDDFKVNRTKRKLRAVPGKTFSFKKIPIAKARALEKKRKAKMKFNHR
jgi:hypothetical protein